MFRFGLLVITTVVRLLQLLNANDEIVRLADGGPEVTVSRTRLDELKAFSGKVYDELPTNRPRLTFSRLSIPRKKLELTTWTPLRSSVVMSSPLNMSEFNKAMVVLPVMIRLTVLLQPEKAKLCSVSDGQLARLIVARLEQPENTFDEIDELPLLLMSKVRRLEQPENTFAQIDELLLLLMSKVRRLEQPEKADVWMVAELQLAMFTLTRPLQPEKAEVWMVSELLLARFTLTRLVQPEKADARMTMELLPARLTFMGPVQPENAFV
jgi:hypothetical protein